jgi:hypothetical protein
LHLYCLFGSLLFACSNSTFQRALIASTSPLHPFSLPLSLPPRPSPSRYVFIRLTQRDILSYPPTIRTTPTPQTLYIIPFRFQSGTMYDDTVHESTHRKQHFFSRLSSSPKQRDTRKRRSEGRLSILDFFPTSCNSCKTVNYYNEPLRVLTAMPIIVQSPTPTEEDATPTTPPRSLSRRRSRLEQWIGDQHAHTGGDQGDGIAPGSSPNSYPYLAYCDTRQARSASCDIDSRSIQDSFVLVGGDDGNDGIGGSCREELNEFEVRANHHVTTTVLIYAHSLLHTGTSSLWFGHSSGHA